MGKYILLIFLLPVGFLFSQFNINEASNANGNTIVLPSGSTPDWIEIYNGSAVANNIGGYGLSDDRTIPMKWTFPTTTISPLGFLVVHAVNKNTVNFIDHYETSVFADSIWKYIIPTADIPQWNSTTFNSGAWLSGPASIGYGDGDDATDIIGPYTSVYYRINFQCTNINAIKKAILDIDYDDGFVAYLNGVEIARAGLTGAPPTWNELANDHEATIPQGGAIPSFEIDTAIIQAALTLGNNVLAIEIHNTDPNSSDLTGKPYLTFGYDSPGTFASGTTHPYFTATVGGTLEANFGLATSGEMIYLSNPAGVFIDSLLISDLEPNMSNGKLTDGGIATATFTIPTPNASNNTSIGYDGYENQATITNTGGVFQGPILANMINNSVANGELRYTTTGVNPSVNSPLVVGPILLSTNCVLKVRCFPTGSSNLLPSLVATETFLFQEDFSLPIVSLTIDSVDLYGGNGIFDNWWTDWRKPCVVEYFDKNGIKKFETRASVKPDGGAGGSRSNPQHSVTIEPANSLYGEGVPVHYPIIPQKPYIEDYYALYIRNGSNFWNQSPQRDATMCRIMAKTNVNSQGYTPAVVYLNGQYFGIYELREKANEGYFKNNYNNDMDSLDLLSVSYFYGAGVIRIVKGSDTSFYSMRDYITTADATSPSYFNDCNSKLDLYNYTDYIAGENWYANADWIYNNMKMARTRTTDNKWRFFLQDLEWGLGGWTDYNANMFDWFRYNQQPNPFWQIYDALVQNTEFKNYFVNRYADLMNFTFQSNKFTPIIDSMYNELLPDLPRHFQLWTGDVAGGMANFAYWRNVHIGQFNNRNAVVRDQMVAEFSLVKKVNVSLDVFPAGAGYIKISTIVPEILPWTGVYFDGVPVKITAIANPGYTFKNWVQNITLPAGSLLQSSITQNIDQNDLFKAVFIGSPEEPSLTISEINYNPDPTVDGGNWIELHNFGSTAMDLTAWHIKTKNHYDKFSFEDHTIIPPNGYLVVCENMALFNSMYPQVQNVVGGTGFVWSNKYDSIRVFNPFDSMALVAVYSDEAPYPKCADGWGRTLENKHTSTSLLDENSWFCGCIGGSPGKAFEECEEPIYVSEFSYNNTNQIYNAGDWIELYNNTSSDINLAGYVFKDSKNDHEYIFPTITLAPDAFLVVGNDLSSFSVRNPLVQNVIGQFNFGLSPKDGIRLYDNNGILISSFNYDTIAPWSNIPSYQDFTNEYNFYQGYLNPTDGLSWFIGCEGGSPGTKYVTCPVLPDGEFAFLYPNPSSSNITITINNTASGVGLTELEIYNLNGQLLYKQILDKVQESVMSVEIDVTHFLQGVYYVKILQADQSKTLPFVKL